MCFERPWLYLQWSFIWLCARGGALLEECRGTCITGGADCCLFSALSGWELGMGIEEYRGR